MSQRENQIGCSAAKKCGGCQLQYLDYSEQLAWKQSAVERMLGRFGKVAPILGMKDPLHYRKKVQAMYYIGKGGRVQSGVYQSGSHSVVPVANCMIQDEIANRILRTIGGMLKDFRVEPYSLRTGRGLLRHVLIRRGAESGQILVALVTASPIFQTRKYFAAELKRRHPEITTIVHNVNRDYEGLMLGRTETVLLGEGWIEDTLCGCTFRISSRSFYQVNPEQTEKLYREAMRCAGLQGQERVIDAYCGVGTIGLIAARHAGQVIGVESNRDAVRDAIANAKRNAISNARFYCADASEWLEGFAAAGESADVVFTDPPRAGCSEEFLRAVTALAPKKVVYVSCNPETQARDLKLLTGAGWRVSSIQPVDLFPYTKHVESVVLLSHISGVPKK